jgi:hypothetical protein
MIPYLVPVSCVKTSEGITNKKKNSGDLMGSFLNNTFKPTLKRFNTTESEEFFSQAGMHGYIKVTSYNMM